MAELSRYLERIGFSGTPRVDLDGLRELHRRHLLAIPYENLDVQLGRHVGLGIDAIYDKLVVRGRGGWCYEMNGLLAWALESLGYSITRLAAGVMRVARGDAALGNHLAIWVRLPGEPVAYLADVGFGDGALEPVAIRAGAFSQHGFEFALESLAGGWWRFHNHPHGGAASFDFQLAPADPGRLASQCAFLQTSPLSPFTQVAVAQRHTADGLAVLRGRVLTRIAGGRAERHEVAGRVEYFALLHEVFGIDLSRDTGTGGVAAELLWQRVSQQHAAFLERLMGTSQPQAAD